MVIVPKKVTKAMVESVRGICGTNGTEAEKIQLLWTRLLEASGGVDLDDRNEVFALGKRTGVEKIREGLSELLNLARKEVL